MYTFSVSRTWRGNQHRQCRSQDECCVLTCLTSQMCLRLEVAYTWARDKHQDLEQLCVSITHSTLYSPDFHFHLRTRFSFLATCNHRCCLSNLPLINLTIPLPTLSSPSTPSAKSLNPHRLNRNPEMPDPVQYSCSQPRSESL